MKNEVNKPEFWNSLYLQNKDGWDLKTPSPVFVDLLDNDFFTQQSSILFVGCGKGYDAIAAAKSGLKVTAVDFSEEALSSARSNAFTNNVDIKLISKDIFVLSKSIEERFDYVFDYVTYCAIDPFRREEYIVTIHSLLKPGGKFVIVIFPIEKRETGPPFGIDESETINLFSKYLILEKKDNNINSVKPRKGRESLHIYRKETI